VIAIELQWLEVSRFVVFVRQARDSGLARGCLIAAAILASAASAPAQSAPASLPSKGSHKERPPELSSADSLAVPPPIIKTGCSTFELAIDGEAHVVVTPVRVAECGPITPIIVGIPGLDAGRRIVHIPVALHNEGPIQLHGPAWIAAPIGSIVTTAETSGETSSADASSGRPIATPAASPHYAGGDSHRDSAGAEPVLARWSYDSVHLASAGSLVRAADGSVVLGPDATSAAMRIDLEVPPGVTGARITLRGFGTYVLTVPARPADTVPVRELLDSRSPGNVITGDPHFPGRAVRDRLWLLFRSGATAEEREAAVEAINGIVLGGVERGTGNGYPPPHGPHRVRYYYVAFPAYPDSGAAPLERAIHALALLPQVHDVRAIIIGQD
jgi:hypothetical protein